MQEGDFNRRIWENGAQYQRRPRVEDEAAGDAGFDVVVQAATLTGKNPQFFAKIDDVRREGEKGNEEDRKK